MLNLSLSADQTLVIESAGVTLRGLQLVLNGALLKGSRGEVISSEQEKIEPHYTSPSLGNGVFGLKATPPDDGCRSHDTAIVTMLYFKGNIDWPVSIGHSQHVEPQRFQSSAASDC